MKKHETRIATKKQIRKASEKSMKENSELLKRIESDELSDEEILKLKDWERRHKTGKEIYYHYESAKITSKHLGHNCDKLKCKPYRTTRDDYGNKVLWFK